MPKWLVSLGFFVSLVGCVPPAPGGGVIVGDVMLDAPRNPDRPLSQALGPNGHHIIFCNFDGGTMAANYDDSIHNKSSIAAGVGHNINVPPFDFADYSLNLNRDQIIADVMKAVRKFYAPYNVDVVSTRPQAGDYVMAMVGGDPSLIGEPCQNGGCVAGIAPLDCQRGQNGKIFYNDGGDIEVVYAFSAVAKVFGGGYQRKVSDLAVTIAQETAHAYGLGHSNNVQDVMYPAVTGQTTGFLAGKYADGNNCAGGVGTQDANALLLQILGASQVSADPIKPTVSVTAPTAGATVPRTFTVTATAADNVGIEHVELSAAGPAAMQSKRVDAPPFTASFTVAADGAWAITATAFDAAGNTAFATINVSVTMDAKAPFGAPCTTNAQCASDLCAGGICNQKCGACPANYTCNLATKVCDPAMMMVAPGEVGAMCAVPDDCNSKICADYGGYHFCTGPCSIDDPNSCPAAMYCADFGADGLLCTYRARTGGGGCSLAPPRPASAPWGFALLFAIGAAWPLLRRRR